MKKRCLLIDFDNTLMETEAHSIPVLLERFNALYAKQLPSPLTPSQFFKQFHGLAGRLLCDKMSAFYGFPIEFDQLFHQRGSLMQAYYRDLQKGVKMAPEVIPVLKQCQALGIQIGMVTNSALQLVLTVLRSAENGQGHDLIRLFGANCFEANPHQKPDPDVYLRALSHMKVTPEETLAIEDSVTGVAAARAAGLATLGYVGFADSPAEHGALLMGAGCISTFVHWNELLQHPLLVR